MTLTLHELLPHLREYRRILVTGPQRSGTTIAAEILAHELGRYARREEDVGTDNLSQLFRLYLQGLPFVLQAPALCHVCHLVPDGAVVFMVRDSAAIEASERRIGWQYDATERAKYWCARDVPSHAVKLACWREFQRPLLGERAFELDYESLRGHPLWVESGERQHFHARQTRCAEDAS